MRINTLMETIADQIGNKSLLAIFDRDGTLAPYNPQPKQAIIPQETKALIIELADLDGVQVGILSARSLKQLKTDFKNNNIILAGNYGMQVLLPDKRYFENSAATRARPLLVQAKEALRKEIPKQARTILEDHDLMLCLHWHLTPEPYRELVHSTVMKLRREMPGLVFRALPTSYEVWPPVDWHKGYGLEQIAHMLELNAKKQMIIYVGDSDSDEPAFQWVNKHHGISTRIGNTAKSAAQFQIKSLTAINSYLKQLVVLSAANH